MCSNKCLMVISYPLQGSRDQPSAQVCTKYILHRAAVSNPSAWINADQIVVVTILFKKILQHCVVFLQVADVFSKFRPRACTYRSDPYSCRLVCGTAPFVGPIECKQLLLDVSCVSVHSRCITSHMAGAYTLSFFEIRGRTVQPRLSGFGLSN